MSAPKIQSEAFQQAAQRSEKIRIVGLIGVFASLVVVVILRFLIATDDQELGLLTGALLLLAVATAYEVLMLAVVNRAIRDERYLGAWVWVLNLFVEALFPTFGLVLSTESPYRGPYQALVSPVGLVYFLFIILSTLRLSPYLCRLTGLFSALGYLGVTIYTYWQYGSPDPNSNLFAVPFYVTYAAVLLLGGFTAGAVADQIRAHVSAALREAETLRRLERIEHDLSLARSIQQGLLPSQPPEIEGFEIAGWNQPADETGGDYFDWQELPDGRTAISLADVTGHGIGPALVTAVCRAYARATFPSGTNLQEDMIRINHLLVEDLPAECFVTFAVCILDAAKSRAQLLSAGHGPLLIYRAAEKTVQNFNAQGIPMGLMPGIRYGPPQEIEFAPGDMLVLTTDGFFEWENAEGEQFGLSRLEEVIRVSSDLSADEIIRSIYTSVKEYSGGTEQEDDLTAVVLKRRL